MTRPTPGRGSENAPRHSAEGIKGMTRKSGDRPLDELERRFQALRDQVGALPEARRPGLELLSRSSPGPSPHCGRTGRPGKARRQRLLTARPGRLPGARRHHSAPRLQRHSGYARRHRPGLQHHHDQLARVRHGAGGGPAGPAQVLPGFSSPGPPLQGLPRSQGLRHRSTPEDRKDQSPGRQNPGI